ncbi:hypothetical protein D9M71_505890 [compost metagenome]
MVQQGDRQVVGHALLVMGEQHVAAGGKVGLFHQLLQVFHGNAAEGGEVLFLIQVLLQPAAQRIGARLAVEKAPGLALLGVVAVIEVGQEVFDGIGGSQFGVASMQHGGAAIGLFVDQVNDAMTDWHGILGELQKSSSLP